MRIAASAYSLSEAALDELEREVVEGLRGGDPSRSMACAVVEGDSHLADYGRTVEALGFPDHDMPEEMEPYEEASLFLYTADLDAGHVAHAKRIVRAKTVREAAATGVTGIEVIDDRLNASEIEEIASSQSIFAFHGVSDPRRMWNVATNLASREWSDDGPIPTERAPTACSATRRWWSSVSAPASSTSSPT